MAETGVFLAKSDRKSDPEPPPPEKQPEKPEEPEPLPEAPRGEPGTKILDEDREEK